MDQNLYARLDEWLDDHKEELVSLLSRLIAVKSVSEPGEGGRPFGTGAYNALREMLSIGEEQGFQTQNFDDRCGALWLCEDGEPSIGFWGHLDVVPEGSGWSYPPYSLTRKGDYLIGRGVGDNKGPTVGVLLLLRCLRELNVPLRHSLKLFVGCDEEKGMRDLEYYTAHYPSPSLNIVTDSGFPVCYGEKGILEGEIVTKPLTTKGVSSLSGGLASNMVPDRAKGVFEAGSVFSSIPGAREEFSQIILNTDGVSRHSASPQGAVNAVYKLTSALAESGLLTQSDRDSLDFLSAVNEDTAGTALGIACSDDISGELTCVGSILRTDEAGRVRLNLNIRYPVKADSQGLIDSIVKSVERAGCSFELERNSKPNFFPPEHPIVLKLTEVFNRESGQDKKPFVMGGGTYARKLPCAFAFGLGGLTAPPAPEGLFTPGHGGAHEPDEAVCLSTLVEGLKILARGIIEIDALEG